MGKVEHGLDLPWPELPQVKNTNRKKKTLYLKWLPFSYQIIDRRPKHFAFVASQLIRAYIQYHN